MMIDCTHPLGEAVRRARLTMDKTQCEVADSIDVDVRTIHNIETCKGNPKFDVLFQLIRSLSIDPNDIFYPERQNKSPVYAVLQHLIDGCDEEEAEALIVIIKATLSVMRSKNSKQQ